MKGFAYKLIRRIDTFWLFLSGYTPDFERLEFFHQERKFFTKDALIKEQLSLIPGTEMSLKSAVRHFGGWERLMDSQIELNEEIYEQLEKSGFSREQVDLSRRFLADPKGYRDSALHKK